MKPPLVGGGRSGARASGGLNASQAEPEERESFGWSYFRKWFFISPLGNAFVALALIIGFYHGWLKRSYPGALGVFAYDIPLVLGLMVAWWSVPAKRPLMPGSRTAIALKSIFAICAVYMLIPSDVPWLVRLASLRGWTFSPLMFLVGYHVLRTPQQLGLMARLIVLLCISVTLYGMQQNPADILNAAIEDEGFRKTIDGSTYTRQGGGAGFRVFSTFVGSGMFATALACGIVVAIAEITEPKKSIMERLFWGGGILVSLNGILISGTRSSLITVTIGAAFVSWVRGSLMRFGPVVAALGVVAVMVSSALGTIDSSRMLSAFSPEEMWWRVYIVMGPAIDVLLENPLGQGLGHATHGVPVILSYLIALYKASPIDGDFGHAAVDFGIIGMVAYSVMMIRATQDGMRWAKALKDTNAETVGIISAALFVVSLPAFITGSPFLHVPTGAIIWYYIGGLNRIYDERIGGRDTRAGRWIPGGRLPAGSKGPPMSPVPPPVGPPMLPSVDTKRSPKPGKSRRFLYG